MSKTCAFVPCDQATACVLEGGCLRKPRRRRVPLAPPPKVAYNPMMGSRLDLVVTEEPELVAAKRWKETRLAYLRVLLTGALTPATRERYAREIATLLTVD